MALDETTVGELAAMYLAAERDATPAAPWRERFPGVTEEDAYAVQAELLRLRQAAGGVIAGWKAGATNPGAMANFGLSQPVYAGLFAAMRLLSPALPIRLRHFGAALDASLGDEARALQSHDARYRFLGQRPHARVRAAIHTAAETPAPPSTEVA